jgi:hypothetical protein
VIHGRGHTGPIRTCSGTSFLLDIVEECSKFSAIAIAIYNSCMYKVLGAMQGHCDGIIAIVQLSPQLPRLSVASPTPSFAACLPPKWKRRSADQAALGNVGQLAADTSFSLAENVTWLGKAPCGPKLPPSRISHCGRSQPPPPRYHYPSLIYVLSSPSISLLPVHTPFQYTTLDSILFAQSILPPSPSFLFSGMRPTAFQWLLHFLYR